MARRSRPADPPPRLHGLAQVRGQLAQLLWGSHWDLSPESIVQNAIRGIDAFIREQTDGPGGPYDRATHRDGEETAEPAPPSRARPASIAARAKHRALALERTAVPEELFGALNLLVRIRRDGGDLREARHARDLRAALGPLGEAFWGDEWDSFPVLRPLVQSLEHIAAMIGPSGLVKNAEDHALRQSALWRRGVEEFQQMASDELGKPRPGSLLNPSMPPAAAWNPRQATWTDTAVAAALVAWNFTAAGALLARIVGSPVAWQRRVFRCANAETGCPAPYGIARGATRPASGRCPACSRNKRGPLPRLRSRSPR